MGQSSGAFDICLMMVSPLARGLFQRAIMESGDCESTLIEDIGRPVPFNQVSGTGEGNGEKLATDLGAALVPGAIQKLRSMSATMILNVWSRHPELSFDAIVDGWVIPDQPARIFAEDRQARIPILTGSNADEATVFGPGPATMSAYWKYLRADTGRWAQREFQLLPAFSDAEVPEQYLKLQNATFAFGAWSMARAMSRVGEPTYLYRFTWADGGQRAKLGACHGEELYFLGDTFPRNWTYIEGQEKFGQTVRQYWANFARSGDPGSADLPAWPAFTADSNRVMELGRSIQPVPVSSIVPALSRVMRPVLMQGGQ
jgi:para-nitrobenzyl esterase